MSWLFSEPEKNTTKTFWRIDSASVSVTVVQVETGTILYYDVQPLTLYFLDERHRYDQLLHHTELVMNQMIPRLQMAVSTPSDHAVVVLGEPWSHTVKRHVAYKRKTPFKLTKTFIKDLIDRDMKRLTQEYTTRKQAALELMNPTYHELLIGGHVIPEPWGTMINDVRLEYTTGFSDDRITDSVIKIIHEKTKVRLVNIQIDHYLNYMMRFWKTLSAVNGMIINPSGLVTDISIFQQGSLAQSGTIPWGMSGIEHMIAVQMNMNPDELKVLLSLSEKNLLDDATSVRLNKYMDRAYRAWEKDFQKFASNAVDHGDMIDQVVWMGEQSMLLSYFMHRLRENTVAFPLIFGATHVGFSHSDTILQTAASSIHGLKSNDHIMLMASGLL